MQQKTKLSCISHRKCCFFCNKSNVLHILIIFALFLIYSPLRGEENATKQPAMTTGHPVDKEYIKEYEALAKKYGGYQNIPLNDMMQLAVKRLNPASLKEGMSNSISRIPNPNNDPQIEEIKNQYQSLLIDEFGRIDFDKYDMLLEQLQKVRRSNITIPTELYKVELRLLVDGTKFREEIGLFPQKEHYQQQLTTLIQQAGEALYPSQLEVIQAFMTLDMVQNALDYLEIIPQPLKNNDRMSRQVLLATLLYEKGQFPDAIKACQQGLDLYYGQQPDPWAAYRKKMQKLKVSSSVIESSIAHAPQPPVNNYPKKQFYYILGASSLKLDNLEDAKKYLEQGVEMHSISSMNSSRMIDEIDQSTWPVWHLLGKIYYKLGQLQTSLKYYEQSLSFIEGNVELEQSLENIISRNFGTSEVYEQGVPIMGLNSSLQKTTVFSLDPDTVYQDTIELLLQLHKENPEKGYDRKALQLFEKKQGRRLLQQIGKSMAEHFEGIPDTVLHQEKQLANRFAELQQNSQHLSSSELQTQYASLHAEQDSFEKSIKEKYPNYWALKYPQPVKVDDIQSILGAKEAVLIFSMHENHVVSWVIGKTLFSTQLLGTDANKIRHLLRDLQNQRQNPFTNTLNFVLYQQLFPPQLREQLAAYEMLYIVPTDELYTVPFESLVTEQPTENNPPHYFIQDHAISYLSSASLLCTLRNGQNKYVPKEQRFIAFADPVYNTDLQTKENLDPRNMAEEKIAGYVNLRGGVFAPLPETAEEAKNIQQLFEHVKPGSTTVLLKEQASTSMVKQLNYQDKLRLYSHVLFACHGILPGETSSTIQPALVLSLPDSQGNMDFLTMADVFNLKFNAQLITLSACNTGRGEVQKGEGIIGLTRAFMYAGSQTVSVTLWSVESQSENILSTRMHANLIKGMTPAYALRAAKLEMIQGENPKYRHPFYWAPLILFGNGNPL